MAILANLGTTIFNALHAGALNHLHEVSVRPKAMILGGSIVVTSEEGTRRIRIRNVREVWATKTDEFTIDTVRLEVRTDKESLTLSEDHEGFWDVHRELMIALTGEKPQSLLDLFPQPFEGSWTQIFRR